MLSHFLGLPQLTHMHTLDIDGDKVSGERETDDGVFGVEATLPAVVSVKKKNVETLTLEKIGVDGEEVGGPNAWSIVESATPKPPKSAGEKVTDKGEGGSKIAEYLVAQKLV